MSQHIAGGHFDPTQAVMAQLKALPASPREVPSLDFFEERVARAARRDVKKFQQPTTRCICFVCCSLSFFLTPFLFAYSSALKARERWIAQSSRCSASGAWLSTDPQSIALASLDAIDPTLPHSEDNIQW
jgi:hypothetical protein